MNDTVEIMIHELPGNTLIVHDKALEAAGVALSLSWATSRRPGFGCGYATLARGMAHRSPRAKS